jgi:hypothetical protein
MLTYACNPSYEGAIGRKIEIQSQLWDENAKSYLKNN